MAAQSPLGGVRERAAHVVRQISAHGLGGQLIRGGIGSVAVRLANTALTLAVSIVLARILGPEGFGVYAYAFALVTLVGVVAQLGLPTLVVREVATYQTQGRFAELRGILTLTNQAVLVFSVALAVIAGTAGWLLCDHLASDRVATFAWALVLLPLIALGNLRGAALRGLRRVVEGQLPDQALRPGFFAAALAATATAGMSITPATAMAFHATAAFAAFVIGAALLRRALPSEVTQVGLAYENRRWLRSALPLTFIAGTQIMNAQTGIVMLGPFTTAEDVGVFRVAIQGAAVVAFGLQAVNMPIAPQAARLHAAGDLQHLQRMMTWGARTVLLGALPIAVAFVLAGSSILGFIFGDEFSRGHMALAILCLGQLVSTGAGSVGLLLNMSGNERETAKGLACAATVNVALSAVLIPRLGIEGAATATAMSLAALNVILWHKVRQRLGIDASALGLSSKITR